MTDQPPTEQQLTPDRERKIRRNYADTEPDGTVPLLLGEIDRLREKHKASLRRADKVNNELMEEVQRYAEGKERPVLWSVYNDMHLRAAHAEGTLDSVRRIASRLAAHAVGFGDVLDESDRGPWGRTVGADIAELSAAVAPVAVSVPPGAPVSPVQPSSVSESTQSPTGAPEGALRASGTQEPESPLPDRLEAVLTERFTELGNPYSRMSINFQGPDGWPASKEVGPHDVAEVLRELLATAEETHIVADDSSDPEHVDDCPGCATA